MELLRGVFEDSSSTPVNAPALRYDINNKQVSEAEWTADTRKRLAALFMRTATFRSPRLKVDRTKAATQPER